MPSIRLREAAQEDVPLILRFIKLLAEYERLAHEVAATEELVSSALFGPKAYAEVILAEADGEPAGFALFFHNFSTFKARPGIYLEDLFVLPEMRRKGVGKALIADVARLAVERGCARFEWAVLDWNEPAIEFYRSLGAVGLDDWIVHRLAGEPLGALARSAIRS